jgi:HSP20 family protein
VEVDIMLIRTDTFRDLDRLSQQVFGATGTTARPALMPMDAWRDGDEFVVELDLPGVDPGSIDLDVERNILTVRAERAALSGQHDLIAAERPRGVFSRQLVLGESLDTERVHATYESGVLSLRIPVAEKAKPRKIEIKQPTEGRQLINA